MIGVCLRELPALDAVGEPASLAQRCTTWKAEFELHVTALQISNPSQERALLLQLAGPRLQFLLKFAGAQKTITELWTVSRTISRAERRLQWLDRPF